jgi:hypothetical protein
MDNTDLLPRRLTAPGCVIAGHQLAAHVKALAGRKIKLTKEVEARVAAVGEATGRIEALSGNDTRMMDVDRGADRFIAGLDGMFVEIDRSFDYADVLPLTAAELELRDTASALHAKLLPSTEFIRGGYRAQWERMNALHNEMTRPENMSALGKIGLLPWVDRLGRWVALYGDKLGVTQAQAGTDPVAKGVDGWLVAWADLLLEVRSKYRDPNNEEHVIARQLLLSPYEDQARQERANEVKAAAKRREKKEASPK